MAINDYLSGITRATTGEKTDLSNAAKDLATLQEGAGSLPNKLKEALNTKLNNNKDIINQQADTMQTYFNSGANAREKYQDVFNPFEKAKLVQNERSMALRPYDVLTGVLENRMGSVADIVNAGVQGWQGLMNAAGTKLDLAKTNMATKLQQYLSAVGQQEAADQLGFQIAQAKEASRQFELNYGLDQTKIANQASQFDKQLALDTMKARASAAAGAGDSGTGSQSEIDAYAVMFNKGSIAANDIPAKYRGQALARASALLNTPKPDEAPKPTTNYLKSATNWLKDYFTAPAPQPNINDWLRPRSAGPTVKG